MLDARVESLLQEVATEMAFLVPARLDGLSQVADALLQLGHAQATQSLSDVQQELTQAVKLCKQRWAVSKD